MMTGIPYQTNYVVKAHNIILVTSQSFVSACYLSFMDAYLNKLVVPNKYTVR